MSEAYRAVIPLESRDFGSQVDLEVIRQELTTAEIRKKLKDKMEAAELENIIVKNWPEGCFRTKVDTNSVVEIKDGEIAVMAPHKKCLKLD